MPEIITIINNSSRHQSLLLRS